MLGATAPRLLRTTRHAMKCHVESQMIVFSAGQVDLYGAEVQYGRTLNVNAGDFRRLRGLSGPPGPA